MNTNVYKFMIEVIDTCATRGAFRGDELQNIGACRAALVEAIEQIEAQENQKDTMPNPVLETETPN